MTETPPILELADLRFRWPGQTGFALQVPELTLAPGERLLLLGASGSGKSTLLSLICGTLAAQEGRIAVAGTALNALRPGQRDRFRAEHIGVIFQQFNLLPYARVADNICLPLRFAPARRARVPDPAAEAARLAAALGLAPDLLGQAAGRLSVGQQQRVAAARALIGAPPLIVADEPTSALDADTQAAFLELLFQQASATGSAVLLVSHDGRLGPAFDRTLHISDIAEAA